MAKKRGRVIDETVLEVIEHLLDEWTGKLTWDLLIEAIKFSIATDYTRQALAGHARIANAFSLRKASLSKDTGHPSSGDTRTDALLDKIHTLEAENARLNQECEVHRAMFIRWVHNAQTKNLTEQELNSPLPKTFRGATEEKIVPMRRGKTKKNGK